MFKRIATISLAIFLFTGSTRAQQGYGSPFLFSKVFSFTLFNVEQQKNTTIEPEEKPLSLFVFLSPDCPLCRNYTKTLRELEFQFGSRVNMYGIFPGNSYSPAEITAFEKKYTTGLRLFIDTLQQLTRYLEAYATPQAILVSQQGVLLYTGAIDDWVQALGKKRLKPSRKYLQDAIEQGLQPVELKIKETKAIGCKINDY